MIYVDTQDAVEVAAKAEKSKNRQLHTFRAVVTYVHFFNLTPLLNR